MALCLFVTVRACCVGGTDGLFDILLGGFMRRSGWYWVCSERGRQMAYYSSSLGWFIGGARRRNEEEIEVIDERRIVREVE